MIFQKYPSIVNTYMEKSIEIIKEMGKFNDEWVATVKVHGGNFSMQTDGDQVLAASKNGFLSQSFYGHGPVFDKYKDSVIEVYNKLQSLQNTKIVNLSIFGELFGGYYQHPDVPRNPKATKTQKGISYTPDNDFYMFAICVDGKWLDFDVVMGLTMYIGCHFAYEMCRGGLQDCLDFSNEFQDPIHLRYGLPTIDDNVAEGLVIQPVKPFRFPNRKMCILKSKNIKWEEKAREPKRLRVQKETPQVVIDVVDEMSKYVTENRLMNVLSHHGLLYKDDFGKILGMMSKDVYNDFYDENKESFDRLEKVDQRLAKKMAQKLCVELFKPYFNKHAEI